MTRHAWVLGARGLLGSALSAALREENIHVFEHRNALPWADPALFAEQIRPSAHEFASRLEARDRWMLLWAAGQGTMGSSAESMARESDLFRTLLLALTDTPALCTRAGSFFFASTAGAIYGGSVADTITEEVPPSPRVPYALEKLQQERILADWASTASHVSVLIGRISTLYGRGQAQRKNQGLISHMARCIVRDKPIHIFVPLDTIRDYLHVRDAARDVVRHLLVLEDRNDVTMKIVASEASTTIAQIVGRFEQISTRKPLIVTSAAPLGAEYLRRVCFGSVVPPFQKAPHRTSLLVGISEVLAHERLAFAASAAP